MSRDWPSLSSRRSPSLDAPHGRARTGLSRAGGAAHDAFAADWERPAAAGAGAGGWGEDVGDFVPRRAVDGALTVEPDALVPLSKGPSALVQALCVCFYLHAHRSLYVCLYVCMYVCMYVCIWQMFTHIHTCIRMQGSKCK